MSIKLSVGQRVNLDALTLVKHTTYERKEGTYYGKKNRIAHRYLFRGINDRNNYVYSGRALGVCISRTYNIRATVKRFEPEYDCIRLSRVTVVGEGDIERLLL